MRQGIAREVWRIDSVGPRNRPLISAGDTPIAELSIAWGNDAEANARIIAAAPELLEVLKEFCQDVQAGGPNIQEEWPDLYVTYQHAQAVISKAKGDTCK